MREKGAPIKSHCIFVFVTDAGKRK